MHFDRYFGFRLWRGFMPPFFFFQAEDGIRDGTVTGVQTCALPIYQRAAGAQRRRGRPRRRRPGREPLARSEERRVGKECRSRGSLNDKKKKKSFASYLGCLSWRVINSSIVCVDLFSVSQLRPQH